MTTLLLVADAPWVRNNVLSALEHPGREVSVVETPREAVEGVAAGRDYAAAIVDMQVGSMGGMAICRAIREARMTLSASPLPVILLLDRQADAFLARRAGAARWVLKPFTAHQLRSALNEVGGLISSGVESEPAL